MMPLYESPNLHLHAWSRAPAYSVGCQDIHTTSQNLSRRTNAQISAWLNEALFLFFYSLYTVNIGILLSYKTKCLKGITGTYLSSFLELLFKTMHKRMSAWHNVRVVRSFFFPYLNGSVIHEPVSSSRCPNLLISRFTIYENI